MGLINIMDFKQYIKEHTDPIQVDGGNRINFKKKKDKKGYGGKEGRKGLKNLYGGKELTSRQRKAIQAHLQNPENAKQVAADLGSDYLGTKVYSGNPSPPVKKESLRENKVERRKTDRRNPSKEKTFNYGNEENAEKRDKQETRVAANKERIAQVLRNQKERKLLVTGLLKQKKEEAREASKAQKADTKLQRKQTRASERADMKTIDKDAANRLNRIEREGRARLAAAKADSK